MVKQQDTEKLSKLTPEEIVEAICRLDAVDLVKIGDEAQRKGMACLLYTSPSPRDS